MATKKQGHWYVVRMPLYGVENIHKLSELHGKTFKNRMDILYNCSDVLHIKNSFGICPTINLEQLKSFDARSKEEIKFSGGHAEVRVFLSLE